MLSPCSCISECMKESSPFRYELQNLGWWSLDFPSAGSPTALSGFPFECRVKFHWTVCKYLYLVSSAPDHPLLICPFHIQCPLCWKFRSIQKWIHLLWILGAHIADIILFAILDSELHFASSAFLQSQFSYAPWIYWFHRDWSEEERVV